MTTGSWFVFFKAKNCPHCERIYPEFVELSQDEDLAEQGIVFATMDVPSNRATATRFDIRYVSLSCGSVSLGRLRLFSPLDALPSPLHRSIIRGFPSLIYFHKHKMYSVTGKRNAETWKFFLTKGVDQVKDTAAPIPPPLTPFDQFVKTLKAAGRELKDAASGKQGSEGYMIVALVFILVLVLGGLISLFFLPAKKQTTDKKKQ